MDPDALATLNERIKMMAGFNNAMGLGLIAVGVLRPLSEGRIGSVPAFVMWILAGLAFHGFALYILRYMRKEAVT